MLWKNIKELPLWQDVKELLGLFFRWLSLSSDKTKIFTNSDPILDVDDIVKYVDKDGKVQYLMIVYQWKVITTTIQEQRVVVRKLNWFGRLIRKWL